MVNYLWGFELTDNIVYRLGKNVFALNSGKRAIKDRFKLITDHCDYYDINSRHKFSISNPLSSTFICNLWEVEQMIIHLIIFILIILYRMLKFICKCLRNIIKKYVYDYHTTKEYNEYLGSLSCDL
ncbi:hypothetical protein [Borrelia duttonii]|uniref:hypothetical protein n=1 Tax=Borrelia duttonii TaxID=40834 RepID=UPI00056F3848|nr:hypothetical protein [Borrelia duttonii]